MTILEHLDLLLAGEPLARGDSEEARLLDVILKEWLDGGYDPSFPARRLGVEPEVVEEIVSKVKGQEPVKLTVLERHAAQVQIGKFTQRTSGDQPVYELARKLSLDIPTVVGMLRESQPWRVQRLDL